MTHILLVEDDLHIATGLKFNLEMEGYTVSHAKDGLSAKKLLFDQTHDFALLILDIMLPHMSGFDLCHALRRKQDYTPILMLTARNFEKDKIKGLLMGADDYLTKPFNLEELLMRLQVMLRRQRWENQSKAEDEHLTFRDITIDFARFTVRVGSEFVKLTPLEMKLMKYFGQNEGHVLSREDLLENVWDIKDQGSLRTVDNFVMRLRKFFELDPSNPQHFLSIRGIGYKFVKGLD